jgi:hypothetical protein
MSDFQWYEINGTKVRGPFVWLIAERLRQAERNRRAQEEADREYRQRMEKQEREREERRRLQAEKDKDAVKERAEQEAETARKVAAWRAEQAERIASEKAGQEQADQPAQEADRAAIRDELDKAADTGEVEVTPAGKVVNWMEADRAYLQAVDDGRPKEEIAALRAGRGEAAQLLERDDQARAVLTERERERVETQSFQLDKERRQAIERDRGDDLGR